MKDIYLVSYSVKGIKSLDQRISLSFYKKIISNHPDTQQYNVKGIYGMNGSGKSGIVTSVDIFRNLLINPGYLNNPVVQKKLDAMVNKKLGELSMEAEFIAEAGVGLVFFKYRVALAKTDSGKYAITYEDLSVKRATSKKDSMEPIFLVINGEIVSVQGDQQDEFFNSVLKKTINLLPTATMSALFYEKSLVELIKNHKEQFNTFFASLVLLLVLGKKLHVYLDESDDHRDYLIQSSLGYVEQLEDNRSDLDDWLKHFLEMDSDPLNIIYVSQNFVAKAEYERFEKTVAKLYEFLKIFKSNLLDIEIDKKEDYNVYVCSLIMIYDSYKIHAEFESTGIKKLIRLFAYLREMAQGGIVFIDEFDSNLHDVYLCALLEYLMEYGQGQLCFTTHNVGPMDILKRHKKSIDFLSEDHKIYPWTTNGNYSPSNLYRNGMIEGSPFNVDSIDFIGVFSPEGEDDSWASS